MSDSRISCNICPLNNVETKTLCERYCSDMADFGEEIRTEAIDDVIERIEEVLEWYKEKHNEIYDVQICIVLDDFEGLISELKEKTE